MTDNGIATAGSRTAFWAGWVVTAVPVAMLLLSGVFKLLKPTQVLEEFERLGYGEGLAIGLGILEIACTFVYAVPRTATLGAVLLTGYLGGAVATHVRVGDQFIGPVALGVLIWAGLYLRDRRLRVLLPVRT